MTARIVIPHRASRAPASSLDRQLDALRVTLLAERAQYEVRLARCAATLAALRNSRDEMASRDRALAALHMYGARDAIERVEGFLVRLAEAADRCSHRAQPHTSVGQELSQ
jgi:hypothetical protein